MRDKEREKERERERGGGGQRDANSPINIIYVTAFYRENLAFIRFRSCTNDLLNA